MNTFVGFAAFCQYGFVVAVVVVCKKKEKKKTKKKRRKRRRGRRRRRRGVQGVNLTKRGGEGGAGWDGFS